MSDADVIVAGAGPVGMLAALLAAQRGMRVLLLEQSETRRIQSRAIGITPPSLEILRTAGLANAFIAQGIAVRSSGVSGGRMRLGRLDFSDLQGDFRFVLAIPQDRTETLLEEAILAGRSIRFLRGHRVTGCTEGNGQVAVTGECAAGGIFRYSGRYLLGCDGGKSSVRESIGVRYDGVPQRYTFLMGDFEDHTGWGEEARLFVTPRGSVESFPLPGGRRRYVLRTQRYIKEYSGDYLVRELVRRAGVDVGGVVQYWESGFGVRRFIAPSFCRGRVFLCGDAAHLMSAVGGQNMNTGFADAELAAWLTSLLITGRITERSACRLYDRVRRRAARAAALRAQFMMLAGTSGGQVWSAIRNAATFLLLHTPVQPLLIRLFSMQSIPGRNLEHCQAAFERELGI